MQKLFLVEEIFVFVNDEHVAHSAPVRKQDPPGCIFGSELQQLCIQAKLISGKSSGADTKVTQNGENREARCPIEVGEIP